MSWQPGESGNPSGRKNGSLNRRTSTNVREHIQAIQLVNRLQAFVLGENDKQTEKPIELNGAQVKAACYLISQRIGSPPQEINTQVDVQASVVLRALVARVGDVEKARAALGLMNATGLAALLPQIVAQDAGERVYVDGETIQESAA